MTTLPEAATSEKARARAVLVALAGLDGPTIDVYRIALVKTKPEFNNGSTWDADRVYAAARILGLVT